MATTTPSAQIVANRGRGHLPGVGCNQREPERDQPGIMAICPSTATHIAAHVDVAVQHGPMCHQHARQQIARCLDGTCECVVYRDGAYVVEPTPR